MEPEIKGIFGRKRIDEHSKIGDLVWWQDLQQIYTGELTGYQCGCWIVIRDGDNLRMEFEI